MATISASTMPTISASTSISQMCRFTGSHHNDSYITRNYTGEYTSICVNRPNAAMFRGPCDISVRSRPVTIPPTLSKGIGLFGHKSGSMPWMIQKTVMPRLFLGNEDKSF
jgi:hypothetical protein